MDDVIRMFVPLAVGPGPVEDIRGPAFAIAQDWLRRIPAGPARDKAIRCLSEATELACEAVSAAS